MLGWLNAVLAGTGFRNFYPTETHCSSEVLFFEANTLGMY
jgi:hypothetical protein